MGTALAWVLVRDRFWGKRLVDVVIDVPFALPTIVAGLVLLSLYGPTSPLGVNVANTRIAVFLALAFVTLPFVVRTVQPVLESLERDVEEAAASLGAGRLTTFRRVILPSLIPGDRGRRGPVLRARDQRVRLARAALRQPARQDRGRVGARPDLHRERQPRRRPRRSPRSCCWSRCSSSWSSTSSRGGWPAVATSTYTRDPAPVRWGLRIVTVGYVVLLVAWPTALVFKNALADGVGGDVRLVQGPRDRARALPHRLRSPSSRC